jgi:tRNA U54 and U55 pseudouridine synthase Pus10
MLGNGRPFAVRLINPKKSADFLTADKLQEIRKEINKNVDISVSSLFLVSKKVVEILNVGVEG